MGGPRGGHLDLEVAGGPDKAVYAYASEDYRWWSGELGKTVGPGTLGENLTVEGVDLTRSVVGEVWAVGTTRLQVAQPRLPCFKIGIRTSPDSEQLRRLVDTDDVPEEWREWAARQLERSARKNG